MRVKVSQEPGIHPLLWFQWVRAKHHHTTKNTRGGITMKAIINTLKNRRVLFTLCIALTAMTSVGCRGIAKGLSNAAKRGGSHGAARGVAHAYRANSTNSSDITSSNDLTFNSHSDEAFMRSMIRSEVRSDSELRTTLQSMDAFQLELMLNMVREEKTAENPEWPLYEQELRTYHSELRGG